MIPLCLASGYVATCQNHVAPIDLTGGMQICLLQACPQEPGPPHQPPAEEATKQNKQIYLSTTFLSICCFWDLPEIFCIVLQDNRVASMFMGRHLAFGTR